MEVSVPIMEVGTEGNEIRHAEQDHLARMRQTTANKRRPRYISKAQASRRHYCHRWPLLFRVGDGEGRPLAFVAKRLLEKPPCGGGGGPPLLSPPPPPPSPI